MGADRAGLRALLDAATKGPWSWRGNTDSGDVRLQGARADVLGIVRRERTTDDPAAKSLDEYLQECERSDGKGGWRPWTAAERRQRVRRSYLVDGIGEPRTDNVLAFVDPEKLLYEGACDLAVYEVARNQGLPDDTPRSHPQVYRGDVVDVRSANARLIRDGINALPGLLDDLDAAERERDQALAALAWIELDMPPTQADIDLVAARGAAVAGQLTDAQIHAAAARHHIGGTNHG
ncbi:hypothetical protein MXD62_23020 [Frankia sp. Mgl5]|uniref:hypothetical protein n=1 Tax=Frankia sp. Mgl5 TaxID=2933793 RepID=UPI00200FFBE9|nr:hypothetical protein [Frankia sp. Mgl5]MCK9930002.1 hypothetical protein [Frankia sp. Mgl5]